MRWQFMDVALPTELLVDHPIAHNNELPMVREATNPLPFAADMLPGRRCYFKDVSYEKFSEKVAKPSVA